MNDGGFERATDRLKRLRRVFLNVVIDCVGSVVAVDIVVLGSIPIAMTEREGEGEGEGKKTEFRKFGLFETWVIRLALRSVNSSKRPP